VPRLLARTSFSSPLLTCKIFPPKSRGILGEDFLQNFDILIDYHHQIIQLESGLGTLAETLTGEHLPVQLSGALRGEPTFRRLILGASRQMFEGAPFNSSGLTTMETRTVRRLDLRKDEVNDLTVIAHTGQPESDTDGLIPTSLFHSIFISHQGGFVILNPSRPKKSR